VVEMACWDIKGKALGVPVWQLLGGREPGRLRVRSFPASGHSARARLHPTVTFTAGVLRDVAGVRPVDRAAPTCGFSRSRNDASGRGVPKAVAAAPINSCPNH
ncbi:hypothetical protein ABZV76_13440, partial [Streptomyces tendae]